MSQAAPLPCPEEKTGTDLPRPRLPLAKAPSELVPDCRAERVFGEIAHADVRQPARIQADFNLFRPGGWAGASPVKAPITSKIATILFMKDPFFLPASI
jgi:hypothetical protein